MEDGIDAFVADTESDAKATFVSEGDVLLCVTSDFDAFKVGETYTGEDILDAEV